MLSQLRDASKTWIAAIFILLLVGSFMIFGVEDVFRSPTDSAIARVGEVEINERTIRREFDNLRQELAGPAAEEPVPTEQALQFGLDRVALNRIISRTVFDEKARQLGLTTADTVLAEEIRSSDVFAGPTGTFDEQLYLGLLRQNNLSPAAFENSMRDDLTRTQLVDSLTTGFTAPRLLADALYRFRAERRRLTYIVVTEEVAGDIPEPEESDLKTLYDSESFRFAAPERRGFAYLAIRPADLTATIDIADERIAEEYEFRRESFRKPETRAVRQVVFQDADAAATARTKIADGTGLPDIAADQGLSGEDIDLGTMTRDDFIDPAVGDAVFALEEPGVTAVIEGALGFVIAEVTQITAGEERGLDAVRDELREELALDAALDVVNDLIERVEDARAEGQTLEEAAKTLDLTVVSIEGASRQGENAGGAAVEGFPGDPAIVQAVFDSPEGVENPFEPLDDGGYFVVDVREVIPSSTKPFETVRDDVAALWRARRTESRLKDEAEALAERIRTGESFESVAADIGGRVVTPVDPLDRDAIDDVLSEAVLGKLFRLANGGIATGGTRDGAGHVVAQVTEIVPAAEETAEAAIRTIRSRIEQALPADAVQVAVSGLRETMDVTINDAALDRAVGRTNGSF